MIIYFADRELTILGQASTELPEGITIVSDTKTEEVENGVNIFECFIPFKESTRLEAERYTEVGNYLLRKADGENEFYTIIESEIDTQRKEIYVYAEDAGMDLINEVFGEFEADKAYSIDYYINLFAGDSGFKIGINEAKGLTRKLKWDGEATATERIASTATQFDGCEISYTFDIDGLVVTNKYINIYKQRGKDIGIPLRLNKEISRIVTTKSIANLATALQCEGGVPDDKEEPITLDGYKYDDGDFYVDGSVVYSRKALERWKRYLWINDDTKQAGGHIVKLYDYDTTSQATLCAHAITELKKIRDMEVNYEIEVKELPENVKIGDRVNIIDDVGELYLSSRILKLQKSVADQKITATLGEYLLKTSGISEKVAALAADFAKSTVSVKRAAQIANKAAEDTVKADNAAKEAAQNVANAQANLDTARQNLTNILANADATEAEITEAQAEVETARNAVNEVMQNAAATNGASELAAELANVAQAQASESLINQVADMIRMSVTDSHGQTVMKQTAEGWTFDISSLQDAVNKLTENVKIGTYTYTGVATKTYENVSYTWYADGNEDCKNQVYTFHTENQDNGRDIDGVNYFEDGSGYYYVNFQKYGPFIEDQGYKYTIVLQLSGISKTVAEEMAKATSFMLDDNNTLTLTIEGEITEPAIDLCETDTGFKLKITNTRILFTDGENNLVWIDSKKKVLNTQKVKADEVQLGGWIWQARNNGRNIGLVWKGV